jgi:hypothetical protein
MDKLLQIALVAGVFASAFVLFEHSENGRYSYTSNGNDSIIVDTRTGEFWTQDGNHFEPRVARVTIHHPAIDNQTASDDRSNNFSDCVHDAVTHNKEVKDCVAQLKSDSQGASKPASTSETSH